MSNTHFDPSFASEFRAISSTMPIDAVVPWVDGADPDWQARKRIVAEQFGRSHWRNNLSCRYRSWGMIEFSLWGLLRNAPWIRQIFLITDKQRPANLDQIQAVNKSIPIRVIDHRQFIAEEYLPSFNISSIMTFFHRIPNLSELFFYAEDDMFLFEPEARSNYLDCGGKILISRGWNDPREQELRTSTDFFLQWCRIIKRRLRNAAEFARRGLASDSGNVHYKLLLDRTEKLTNSFCNANKVYRIYCPPHSPHLLLKSGFEFAERYFPSQIRNTRRNKFRSLGDICARTIALNFAHAQGLLEVHPDRETFVALSRDVGELKRALADSMNFHIVCINDNIIGEEPVDPEIELLLADYLGKRIANGA